jgi:hypothetical protein
MNISDFENKWVKKLDDGLLKNFPDDFIEEEKFEEIQLPGKPLLKGSELFGQFEIIDTDGFALLSTDNPDKIRYILYSNRNTPSRVKIVNSNVSLSLLLKKYTNHLDEIIRMITHDFKTEFPTSDKSVSVTNKIFQLLNLHRY